MNLSFLRNIYEEDHNCVSWSGLQCEDTEQFSVFLNKNVLNRLDDGIGDEEFRHHLDGLALTGLGQESLAAVLNAEHSEERTWAAGEALAEAFLEEKHHVSFPWNMERDKRNPLGSLPGADIIGFIGEDAECCFALGEVKSSSEKKYPPQVMSGRSGHMGHQLDKLANNLTTICQLLKWLLPRVKDTPYQEKFSNAATCFFNSGNKQVVLFGILIRDTQITSNDLSTRGIELGNKLSSPATCQLIALYLPWEIKQLVSKIRKGGAP